MVETVAETVETVTEVVPDVVETATETVESLTDGILGDDGLVGGLLGGAFTASALDAVGAPVETVTETTSEMAATSAAIADPLVMDATETAETVEDTLSSGLDASAALVTPVVADAVETAAAATDPLTEEGDDGFLDTLIGEYGALDLLGESDTPEDTRAPSIFEGLLGEGDIFGLDVPGADDGSDDLFAGLSGGESLSGSLIDQGVLALSDDTGADESDPEIDGLLNNILAGGVEDLFAESSTFDQLFQNDDTPVDGPSEDVPAAEPADSGVFLDESVEDALNVLFDHSSSLVGGLFGGHGEDDAV